MNINRPILSLQQSCDSTVPSVVERLQQSGLHVMRTFDLHRRSIAVTNCSCPHHGTDQCDCQMIVLLVYGKDNVPASLLVHGHNGQTWFSLVEFLGATSVDLENQILSILTSLEKDLLAGDI